MFLSLARSFQSMPSHLTSWKSILILSSHLRLGLPSGLFLSAPFHQIPVRNSTRYLPRPSHSSCFDYPCNIWWAVQTIKLHIMSFSPLTYYLIPLRHTYLPQDPILEHPSNIHSFCFSFSVTDQISHPYKTTGKIDLLLTFRRLTSTIVDVPHR